MSFKIKVFNFNFNFGNLIYKSFILSYADLSLYHYIIKQFDSFIYKMIFMSIMVQDGACSHVLSPVGFKKSNFYCSYISFKIEFSFLALEKSRLHLIISKCLFSLIFNVK